MQEGDDPRYLFILVVAAMHFIVIAGVHEGKQRLTPIEQSLDDKILSGFKRFYFIWCCNSGRHIITVYSVTCLFRIPLGPKTTVLVTEVSLF